MDEASFCFFSHCNSVVSQLRIKNSIYLSIYDGFKIEKEVNLRGNLFPDRGGGGRDHLSVGEEKQRAAAADQSGVWGATPWGEFTAGWQEDSRCQPPAAAGGAGGGSGIHWFGAQVTHLAAQTESDQKKESLFRPLFDATLITSTF